MKLVEHYEATQLHPPSLLGECVPPYKIVCYEIEGMDEE